MPILPQRLVVLRCCEGTSKNGLLVLYKSVIPSYIWMAYTQNLCRETVEKEVVYVVLGVNEEGNREILDFFVGGQESAYGWQGILQHLYKIGVKEVLLGVFEGLTGLEEAFKAVYPKADVQRCVVHKVRNTLSRVRKKTNSNDGGSETHLSFFE
jgi:putative transposase